MYYMHVNVRPRQEKMVARKTRLRNEELSEAPERLPNGKRARAMQGRRRGEAANAAAKAARNGGITSAGFIPKARRRSWQ